VRNHLSLPLPRCALISIAQRDQHQPGCRHRRIRTSGLDKAREQRLGLLAMTQEELPSRTVIVGQRIADSPPVGEELADQFGRAAFVSRQIARQSGLFHRGAVVEGLIAPVGLFERHAGGAKVAGD
jgi:hypothetical protein